LGSTESLAPITICLSLLRLGLQQLLPPRQLLLQLSLVTVDAALDGLSATPM
jgi:hypothetical protein